MLIAKQHFSLRYLAIAAVAALALAAAGCGRPHGAASKNDASADASDPNVPTLAEQQAVFGNAQFENDIALHVPADDLASTQLLASMNGTTVEWWTYIRNNVGCVQQGYGTVLGSKPVPSVDNSNLDGNQLEATLEQAGVRVVQNYSITLNPTPWGAISRSFACTINSDSLAPYVNGQNVHGDLAIAIGQRVCSRWTYVNHYEGPAPGQNNAKLFAGTFSYTMKSLVGGMNFTGDGTATVKMYFNPDNGQWTTIDFELHDPAPWATGFSGVIPADPPQSTCPGP